MKYEHHLASLKDLRISKLGRAADLVWLQFGVLRDVNTRYGTKTVGEWALHIQTSWRFVRESKIVVGVGDLYIFPDGETYDFEGNRLSKFDERANQLNQSIATSDILVQQVLCDDVGGFSLVFTDNSRFDVFPKISEDTIDIEHWRLLQPEGSAEHVVCETGALFGDAG